MACGLRAIRDGPKSEGKDWGYEPPRIPEHYWRQDMSKDSTNSAPDQDPIAEEGRRLLEEDPEFRADVEEFGARLARNEVSDAELVPHAEVVRRFGLTLRSSEITPE